MSVDWKVRPEGRLALVVLKGTVARFEDRFVSVVVLKSNSYGDGCALLHIPSRAWPIDRQKRSKKSSLTPIKSTTPTSLPKLRHNSHNDRVSRLGLHSKTQKIEGQGAKFQE